MGEFGIVFCICVAWFDFCAAPIWSLSLIVFNVFDLLIVLDRRQALIFPFSRSTIQEFSVSILFRNSTSCFHRILSYLGFSALILISTAHSRYFIISHGDPKFPFISNNYFSEVVLQ